MLSKTPIDIVITWVDGNEPLHKKKIQTYLNESISKYEDIAAPTRFRSEGEIYFCVASILRFATFVRKIFIISDQQNPCMEDFIHTNFPDTKIKCEIIDHTTIFSGYEQYLPVFNSLSIETCLFRIPDLSENFVYFNDDVILLRPIRETDWFIDDKAVAFGSSRLIFVDKFISFLKPTKNGHKPFGYKDSIINATNHLSVKYTYFQITHTPQPLKRSILEQFYLKNPSVFISNISHKFRNYTQFNPQALFYMLALKAEKCIVNSENKLLLIKPIDRKNSYVKNKIEYFEKKSKICFCCIESIDLAEKDIQIQLFDWLKKILDIKIK